jgi:hypothetical protein
VPGVSGGAGTNYAMGRRKAAASVVPGSAPRSRLEIVWRPVEALKGDAGNPRSHGRRQVRQLAASIKAFGFNVPILVDRELRVLAGHGRLLAVRELGWTEVPTIVLNHLTEAQARAFTLAENRFSENSSWDDRLLAPRLQDLSAMELDFDIEMTGFERDEIALRSVAPEPIKQRGTARSAAAKRQRVCKEGEWWLLGPHRVHIGSSLDPVACASLMAEKGGEGNPTSVCLCVSPARADQIIRRWQTLTGGDARHAESGASFDELAVNEIARAHAVAGIVR